MIVCLIGTDLHSRITDVYYHVYSSWLLKTNCDTNNDLKLRSGHHSLALC